MNPLAGRLPMLWFAQILSVLRLLTASQSDLALENIALRHQICVLSRQSRHPRLRRLDRLFWVCLSRIWGRWKSALVIVKPETVARWHRQGWRLYWRWKSRSKTGCPQVEREIREMVRRIAAENPLWGAPRILPFSNSAFSACGPGGFV